MNEDLLSKQLGIIFDREIFLLDSHKETWSIQINNDRKILIYDHAESLINIYVGLPDDDLKEYFVKYLVFYLVNEEEKIRYEQFEEWDPPIIHSASTGALIFFTLLQLGFKDKLIISIKARYEICLPKNWTNITLINFLSNLLTVDKRYLDIDFISHLLQFSKNQMHIDNPSYMRKIDNLQLGLADLGYDEIKESILGFNIEINRDKAKLISIFSDNGFDPSYEQSLQEIDEFINTNSSFVSSAMIGNMRAFMQDLVVDLSKRIAANFNESIPIIDASKPMGSYRNYLKSKLGLSDNDNSLINRYIDVLHSEGGHSFMANVEYFRLSKNIGIEICLFLLSKANNLKLLKKPNIENAIDDIPF
jgi:hypothetical protein